MLPTFFWYEIFNFSFWICVPYVKGDLGKNEQLNQLKTFSFYNPLLLTPWGSFAGEALVNYLFKIDRFAHNVEIWGSVGRSFG